VMGSPASWDSCTIVGAEIWPARFLRGRSRDIHARVIRLPKALCNFAEVFAWLLPVTAVNSAAKRSMIKPSLSVVQTVPSRRSKARAGAFLAAETERAVEQPGANHLNPTGTSQSRRPRRSPRDQ
jgi:hypothetical protein